MRNKQSQLATATLLHDKLQENVARITWLLIRMYTSMLMSVLLLEQANNYYSQGTSHMNDHGMKIAFFTGAFLSLIGLTYSCR